ncbi:hypothetical protein BpHYR1_017971 [Brachionus plicatilis]|uniref:Uncharacterized protein n=1 Tax=Brachionus plicatilis TaxID=10195 RepID=A0A3M7R705_BRAPC|nr:hypothetical protein BpHYR1_017971 [Brachionus plicatilis]
MAYRKLAGLHQKFFLTVTIFFVRTFLTILKFSKQKFCNLCALLYRFQDLNKIVILFFSSVVNKIQKIFLLNRGCKLKFQNFEIFSYFSTSVLKFLKFDLNYMYLFFAIKLIISKAVGSILFLSSSCTNPAELKRFSAGTDVDVTENKNSQICVIDGKYFLKS